MNTAINQAHIYFLLQGAFWTLVLSLMAFVGGGIGGFVIALCRVSPSRIIRYLAALYVQLIQGIPLLVVLFLTFFGLPPLGITVSPLFAAGVSLTIYVSAYLGEI